jgi:hypothetical protein
MQEGVFMKMILSFVLALFFSAAVIIPCRVCPDLYADAAENEHKSKARKKGELVKRSREINAYNVKLIRDEQNNRRAGSKARMLAQGRYYSQLAAMSRKKSTGR